MDLPVITFEDGWAAVQSAIDKLVALLTGTGGRGSSPFTPKEYVEVYTKCYNMCTQRSPYNWSEQLYQKHGDTIQAYLTSAVVPVLKEKRDEALLKEMVLRWKHHEVMDNWMRKFFMYLDRYYVKHHSFPALHEASLDKFRSLVFDAVSREFVAAILEQINREREGEVVDRDLLKQCVGVFGKMSDKLAVYNEELEVPLLESTRRYYEKKSQDWIEQDSLPTYLVKAEAALQTERERADNYLEHNTQAKLQVVCEKELLEKHEQTLLEKEGRGCRALLQDDRKEDLSRLFRLFQHVDNGLPPIAAIVKEHITKMGEELVTKREAALEAVTDAKDKEALDPQFVESLVELHDRSMQLVTEQFQGHALFQKALKEAFEVFVNHDTGKTSNAELISSFCDRILKTGGAKLSEAEIESFLEKSVQLFSYLSDKDLFSEVYRNQLAKRLLMGRSSSDDAERSMIAKLKLSCGAQFTSKMEGMIKDLLTGGDTKKQFKDAVRGKPASLVPASKQVELSAAPQGDLVAVDGLEFAVEVLTTGHWPTYKQVELALPENMTTCIEVYSKFYNGMTSHRCLKWVHSLGNATVKANMRRTYDLQVTTLQAVALLTFNGQQDWLSLSDILQRLNVEEEVGKRILHSLACAKHKVLKKEPDGRSIGPADKFKVNDAFASPLRVFRIPMASLDETHNAKRVEEDRSYAMEAAIVRIMKARKRMQHQNLVAEVLAQLHFFKPNPRVVKRRIEHLIDREYLEREDNNWYAYLA